MTDIHDQRAIAEGDRRAGGQFRYGTVEERDFERARVRVRLSGDLLSDWLPWATWAAGRLRVWSPPAHGEQCLVLSPSGEPHLGVAVPAVWRDAFPAPSDDPDVTLLRWDDEGYLRYDLATHSMTLHAPCGVHIDGDLIASGDVMAAGGGVSLKEHVHCGVQSGASCSHKANGGGDLPC